MSHRNHRDTRKRLFLFTRSSVRAARTVPIEALEARQLLSAAITHAAPTTAETISGTVYNDVDKDGVQDNGNPGRAGVTVYLDPNYNHKLDPGEQSVVTDANGHYTFTNVPADPEIVRIILPAGASQTEPANGVGIYVGKNTGATLTNENFGVYIPSTITGYVYDDLNKNGVMDPGEGVAGAKVFPEGPGSQNDYVTTNSQGFYSLSGLSVGTWVIAEAPPQGYMQVSPPLTQGVGGAITVTLGFGQTVANQDFVLAKATTTAETISGTVYNDVDKDGVQDNGNPGRAGVTVYLDPNYNHKLDPGEQSVVTDANGHYTFTNVPADPEIVRIILPAGASQTEPANGVGIYVGKNTGATLTNENFGVYIPSTITGYVYDDLNKNGVMDPGEGVAGAKVFPEGPGSQNDYVTTNSQGFYSLSGLSVGTWVIAEAPPQGYMQVSPPLTQGVGGAITVTLGFGQTVANQDFVLAKATTPSISGTVFDDANHDGVQDDGEKGIAGVTVYQDPNYSHTLDPNEQTAETDANGFYIFSNPPADPEILRLLLNPGEQQTTPANGVGIYVGEIGDMTLTGENFGVSLAAT